MGQCLSNLDNLCCGRSMWRWLANFGWMCAVSRHTVFCLYRVGMTIGRYMQGDVTFEQEDTFDLVLRDFGKF